MFRELKPRCGQGCVSSGVSRRTTSLSTQLLEMHAFLSSGLIHPFRASHGGSVFLQPYCPHSDLPPPHTHLPLSCDATAPSGLSTLINSPPCDQMISNLNSPAVLTPLPYSNTPRYGRPSEGVFMQNLICWQQSPNIFPQIYSLTPWDLSPYPDMHWVAFGSRCEQETHQRNDRGGTQSRGSDLSRSEICTKRKLLPQKKVCFGLPLLEPPQHPY